MEEPWVLRDLQHSINLILPKTLLWISHRQGSQPLKIWFEGEG